MNKDSVIPMSREARGLIEAGGGTMGREILEREQFEGTVRPQLARQEACSRLPEARTGGPISFLHPPEDRLYGPNHVYTFQPEHPERIVLFIHGGAYIWNEVADHAIFCDHLVDDLSARVVMPMYTLAPTGTWREGYRLLLRVWEDLLAEGLPIILMGDSAGGGFALGLAEELLALGRPLPEKLVLYSPWLDVTMSNPRVPELREADLSLAEYGLVESGKLWAGDTDPRDRHISPIFFDRWKELPETLLFTGTAELFYPDITELHRLLPSRLVEGIGLFHEFSVYAGLPEGEESRRITREFILG